MRFSTLFALGATVLPVLAQSSETETSVVDQSADFNLVVQSNNKTLDGMLLGACHDGAAYEGLCIVADSVLNTENYVRFQFNTTRYICTLTNSTGTFNISCGNELTDPTLQTGSITWWLEFNEQNNVSSRVSQALFIANPLWSNVAMTQIQFPEYEGEGGDPVAFDKNGLLNIQQTMDDTLEPGSEYLSSPRALYRWYVCWTNYSGYHYTTLTWVVGSHSPQNPTCQKVDVKRVFL